MLDAAPHVAIISYLTHIALYMHTACTANSQVLKGVAVFRRVYQEIGLGWIYAATAWPIVGPLVDRIYDVWARLRLRITGRHDLAQLVTERAAKLAAMQNTVCSTDKCDTMAAATTTTAAGAAVPSKKSN
jgi:DCC1-like thiol-disulfide oxidoreductase